VIELQSSSSTSSMVEEEALDIRNGDLPELRASPFDEAQSLRASHVFDCLEAALAMNSTKSQGQGHFAFEEPYATSDRRYAAVDRPVRILEQISSFVSHSSLVLSDISSTFFLLASAGPAGKRRNEQSSRLHAADSGAMSTSAGSGSEGHMSEGSNEVDGAADDGMSGVDEPRMSLGAESDAGWIPSADTSSAVASFSSRRAKALPQLTVEDSTAGTIYLLAPFSSAMVVNCFNCDIVVGAVANVLHLQGCENVRITVAAGKVLLRNCKDCTVYSSTLAHSVTSGDSRGLMFAPHNTSYQSMQRHLEMAGLFCLIEKSQCAGYDHEDVQQADTSIETAFGGMFWSRVCDVATCVECPTTASSPSGYAIDAAGPRLGLSRGGAALYRAFPSPPEVTRISFLS
jgi:hypothetical protein